MEQNTEIRCFLITDVQHQPRPAGHRSKEILVHHIHTVIVKIGAQVIHILLDRMYFLAIRPVTQRSVFPCALVIVTQLIESSVHKGVKGHTASAVRIDHGNEDEMGLFCQLYQILIGVSGIICAGFDQFDQIQHCACAFKLTAVDAAHQKDCRIIIRYRFIRIARHIRRTQRTGNIRCSLGQVGFPIFNHIDRPAACGLGRQGHSSLFYQLERLFHILQCGFPIHRNRFHSARLQRNFY